MLLGTSDPWCTSHLSHQTSVLFYCRLSDLFWMISLWFYSYQNMNGQLGPCNPVGSDGPGLKREKRREKKSISTLTTISCTLNQTQCTIANLFPRWCHKKHHLLWDCDLLKCLQKSLPWFKFLVRIDYK